MTMLDNAIPTRVKVGGGSIPETPHILIVEDQPNTAEMLTSYFEAQGYEITSVGWGKDALAFVEETLPDLVVLDIRLPDIDGYEVCRHLRAHQRTEHVPIIFLTERNARSDRLTGLELGAVDYITKPFDVQELRLRVRNVLRRSTIEPMSHPITGLPAASLSDEHLRELLTSSNWAVLSVGLRGLKRFSEVYGFVARDDVVRAVALMLRHIVQEGRDPGAFVGHLDDVNIFAVLSPDQVEQIRQVLRERLDGAMSYFYPYADRKTGQKGADAKVPDLDIAIGVLRPSGGSFNDVKGLKRALIEAQGGD